MAELNNAPSVLSDIINTDEAPVDDNAVVDVDALPDQATNSTAVTEPLTLLTQQQAPISSALAPVAQGHNVVGVNDTVAPLAPSQSSFTFPRPQSTQPMNVPAAAPGPIRPVFANPNSVAPAGLGPIRPVFANPNSVAPAGPIRPVFAGVPPMAQAPPQIGSQLAGPQGVRQQSQQFPVAQAPPQQQFQQPPQQQFQQPPQQQFQQPPQQQFQQPPHQQFQQPPQQQFPVAQAPPQQQFPVAQAPPQQQYQQPPQQQPQQYQQPPQQQFQQPARPPPITLNNLSNGNVANGAAGRPTTFFNNVPVVGVNPTAQPQAPQQYFQTAGQVGAINVNPGAVKKTKAPSANSKRDAKDMEEQVSTLGAIQYGGQLVEFTINGLKPMLKHFNPNAVTSGNKLSLIKSILATPNGFQYLGDILLQNRGFILPPGDPALMANYTRYFPQEAAKYPNFGQAQAPAQFAQPAAQAPAQGFYQAPQPAGPLTELNDLLRQVVSDQNGALLNNRIDSMRIILTLLIRMDDIYLTEMIPILQEAMQPAPEDQAAAPGQAENQAQPAQAPAQAFQPPPAQPLAAQPTQAPAQAFQPPPAQPAQPLAAQPPQGPVQPFKPQPLQAQPFAAQPFKPQPLQAQPFLTQPGRLSAGQVPPAQPFAAQPFKPQPLQTQPLAQPFAAQPFPASRLSGGQAPPQQFQAPPQQFQAPPQQFQAPPQQFQAPPQQFQAPPQQAYQPQAQAAPVAQWQPKFDAMGNPILAPVMISDDPDNNILAEDDQGDYEEGDVYEDDEGGDYE